MWHSFWFLIRKVERKGGFCPSLMNILKVTNHKKAYMDLLLLADEQESMIDKYLERGEMFVLDDNGIKGECVVTKEADGRYELKNIAVLPDCQRRGYGKRLITYFPITPTVTGCWPAPATFLLHWTFTVNAGLRNRIGSRIFSRTTMTTRCSKTGNSLWTWSI